jgi:hypothetical protein
MMEVDDDLFPGLTAHMAATKARAEATYDVKMLRKLLVDQCGRERMKEIEREAGSEFGFFWFNNNLPCPIIIRTSKVKVAPVHLIKGAGMRKTPLWQAYFDIKSEYPREKAVGVIFRIPNVGQYVIHNYPSIPMEPGFNTVIRQASNPDKALYMTPWKAFLAGLKKVWTV